MAKTVLIVDDSESIREVVNFTLQNEGYDVLVGVDGKMLLNSWMEDKLTSLSLTFTCRILMDWDLSEK